MKRFFENTDDSGRHVVISNVTGIKYFIEPIEPRNSPRSNWGDLNPATGKVEGAYGGKYQGAIQESESLITPENGFVNITTVEGSYMSEVSRRDAEYEKLGYRPK